MIWQRLSELSQKRSLIGVLAMAEFRVRYKNSILGYFWSLIEPLLMLAVLYFVFSTFMRTEIEHYSLFLFVGIIIWNFFSRATNTSLTSIIGRPAFVTKVYFPREILVISTCISTLLTSLFESVVFVLFLMYFRMPIGVQYVYLPIILIAIFFITMGVSFIVAALNVFYRDVQFIWGVIIQAGFFATPIMYPITIMPESIRQVILLNPIGDLIIAARMIILDSTTPDPFLLTYGCLCSAVLLVVGYLIFYRYEPRFGEEI